MDFFFAAFYFWVASWVALGLSMRLSIVSEHPRQRDNERQIWH